MAYSNETEVTVLGGLTITVEYTIRPAEPDVGLMTEYVDEWSISRIAGRPLRKNEKADWLYARIEKAKQEDMITEACHTHADSLRDLY